MNTIIKTFWLSAIIVVFSSLSVFAEKRPATADDEEDPYFILTEEANRNIKEGQYLSAAERLREAIAMRPDAPENVLLMSNLGLVYSYMDQDSMAISVFDEALRTAPSMRTVLTNRARVLLKMGRDVEAYKDLNRIIAVDSLDTEARYMHGLLAVGWGYLADAEKDFAVLVACAPEGIHTAVGMSTLLTAQGKHTEALEYLRRLVDLSGLEEDYAALAASLIATDRLSEASETITSGLEKYPDSGELYFTRAQLNKARYSLDDAKADARKALALGIEPARVATLKL